MSDDRSTDLTGTPDPLDVAPASSPAPPREQHLLRQAGDVIENLRMQMAELDRREQNVTAQSTALENERRRIRLSSQDFDETMQQREAAFREQEAALAERLDELENGEQEHQSRLAEVQTLRDEVEVERDKLRDELLAEFETERTQIAEERAELDRQRADWDEQRESGIASIEEELEQERQQRQATLDTELLELSEAAAVERTRFDTERQELQAQFDADAEQKQQQLAELQRELDTIQAEKLAEVEQRETDLQRKQVDLEKRTRFHETHLNQLRRSLEQQQTELDRRHQLTQTGHVQIAQGLDAHRHQLGRYRDRLTQREESLDRERHLLDDLRRAFDAKSNEAQTRWADDRRAWDEECEAHRADMRRQQDMLALHAQNLEARRARLDQLRDELEQTHRDSLELRMVTEQVWGQLSQTFGEDTTRKRVEQARTELLAGYEKVRGSLLEQQNEIDEAEHRLTEQRERFRKEREEFADWMSQREQQLHDREESLQHDIQAAADSESQWRTTRERWSLEKIEAESVIRQLLDELDADLTRPATSASPEQIGDDDLPETDDQTKAAA